MKKILYIVLFCGGIIACGSSATEEMPDENTAPTTPGLVFPSNNQLCTDTSLNLQWSASVDSEGDAVSYLLQVATDAGFTQVFHESTLAQNSKQLTFDSGENYYWRVKALDNQEASSSFSAVNSFYSEGVGTENHIPFSPNLIAPLQASSRAAGVVKLEWGATDLDAGDVLSYDVFIGTSSADLQNKATDISDKFFSSTLNSSGTYYWRVDVKDSNGGVTIGQIWEFTIL